MANRGKWLRCVVFRGSTSLVSKYLHSTSPRANCRPGNSSWSSKAQETWRESVQLLQSSIWLPAHPRLELFRCPPSSAHLPAHPSLGPERHPRLQSWPPSGRGTASWSSKAQETLRESVQLLQSSICPPAHLSSDPLFLTKRGRLDTALPGTVQASAIFCFFLPTCLPILPQGLSLIHI